jgi:hypothetical protein
MGLTISISCKAVFVDTDRVPAFDSRVGDLVQNDVEGKLVYQITEAILQSGIEQRQIGVMSLYRQQIKLLSHLLQDKKDIEILTADKSQGRDKDCVIISMVRSNDYGQVCDKGMGWGFYFCIFACNISHPRYHERLEICSKTGEESTSRLRVHSRSLSSSALGKRSGLSNYWQISWHSWTNASGYSRYRKARRICIQHWNRRRWCLGALRRGGTGTDARVGHRRRRLGPLR